MDIVIDVVHDHGWRIFSHVHVYGVRNLGGFFDDGAEMDNMEILGMLELATHCDDAMELLRKTSLFGLGRISCP